MKEIIIVDTNPNTDVLVIVKPTVKLIRKFDFNAHCGMCDKFLTSSCKYSNDKRMNAGTRYAIFNCTSFNQI